MLTREYRDSVLETLKDRKGVIKLEADWDNRSRYRVKFYANSVPHEIICWLSQGDATLLICTIKEFHGEPLLYVDMYVHD